MKIRSWFIGLVGLVSFTMLGDKLFSDSEKRINKTLHEIWEEKSVKATAIPGASTKIDAKYFEIYQLEVGEQQPSYLYITEAPSKVEQFTYMLVFDHDLKIKHTEVLVYRENYGAEISSKRFLKQFLGKSNGVGLDFNKDIDGVSGATISSQSITKSVKEATLHLMELRKQGVI